VRCFAFQVLRKYKSRLRSIDFISFHFDRLAFVFVFGRLVRY